MYIYNEDIDNKAIAFLAINQDERSLFMLNNMVDFIEPEKTHIEIVSDEELTFEEERDRLRLERL